MINKDDIKIHWQPKPATQWKLQAQLNLTLQRLVEDEERLQMEKSIEDAVKEEILDKLYGGLRPLLSQMWSNAAYGKWDVARDTMNKIHRLINP